MEIGSYRHPGTSYRGRNAEVPLPGRFPGRRFSLGARAWAWRTKLLAACRTDYNLERDVARQAAAHRLIPISCASRCMVGQHDAAWRKGLPREAPRVYNSLGVGRGEWNSSVA